MPEQITGPLHDALLGDIDAISGRLSTVERWTKLTEPQRTSVIQARNRAKIARDRLVAAGIITPEPPVEPPPDPGPDPDPDPEPPVDPPPPPPDPEPEPEPEPEPPVSHGSGVLRIDGATVRLKPLPAGVEAWRLAARGDGSTQTWHRTVATGDWTFAAPPLDFPATFRVSASAVVAGAVPEWSDVWHPVTVTTSPAPDPDPDPAPPTTPPPSAGRVLLERPGPFRVMYRKGSNGGGGNVLGGVLGFPSFPETNHAAFEYLFAPEAAFRYTPGGVKLPGLAASVAPTGCTQNSQGWTYRLQLENTSSMPADEAFFTIYAYAVGIGESHNNTGCGRIVSGGGQRVVCKAGEEYRIRLEFLRGTPGQANGHAILIVNGVVAAAARRVNWATPAAPARKVQGESFFGGNNVCPADQWATFAGFRVIDLSS